MTNQEKELIDLIAGYQANGEDAIDARDIDDIAQAIIAKFPQIEKKPVKVETHKYNTPNGKEEYGIKLIQGFETEFKRLQWIEERYVEVF